jgi:adenosylcobinamide kinase/adenosylcobinamide-phosphate guanylyltransferase
MVDADSVVLLECMSNLVANEMFSSDVPVPFEQCAGKIFEDVKKLEECAEELVIVTNNIFEDGVSYDEGTKEYMRALGLVNSWLASNADSIYEVVVGIGIKL